MAFIVEDGTGLPNATAYIHVAYADSYHADRGNTAWTGTTEAKEAAIIRATDFLDRRYQYLGVRASLSQALEWPRVGLYDEHGRDYVTMPDKLLRACAEAALLALTNDLIPTPEWDGNGSVRLKREKVGPIEVEMGYSASAGIPLKRWPQIDLLLNDFLIRGGRTVRG